MPFKNKIVLVTGGSGFIGSHLVEKLCALGAKKVIAFDNFCASSPVNISHLRKNKKFELIVGDTRDFDVLAPLVRKSDFVFNLAASKLVISRDRPRIDLETNIVGTFNVLEAARGTKVRIVHASTGSTLGSSDRPMKEDFPPNPTTLYGISKLTAEKYCQFYAREFGVRASVIRYFHVFGPRQDYSGKAGVVNIFLSRVLQGKQPLINGSGKQIRCLTYVEDDVAATLLIATKDKAIGEIYNVASKTRISVNELANLIIKKYGPKAMKPKYAPGRPGENLKPIPDTSKIERLGFKQKLDFEQALERTKFWIDEDIKRRKLLGG